MSQVASDATAPAFKPAPPIPPRAAPGSDLAPDLPFASLLDDSTQAAAPPPPQTRPGPADSDTDTTADNTADKTADSVAGKTTDTTADKSADKIAGKTAGKTTGKTADKTTAKTAAKTADKTTAEVADTTAIAALPDLPQLPVDPSGGKTAEMTGEATVVKAPDGSKAIQTALQTADNAEITDAANAAGVDTTPTKSKIPGNTKVTTDAKFAEDTKAADTSKLADDGKPAGDSKPADAPAAVVLAADSTKNSVQIITPAAVVAPAPTTAVVNPLVTGRDSQTAPVAIQAATVVADTPKPKAPDLAPARGSTEKFIPAQDVAAKPATAKDGTDKFAPAHPHDEDIAAAPRTAAQTPPSIATDAQSTAPKPAGDAVQQAALTPPSPDVLPAPASPTVPPVPTALAPLAPPAAAVPIAGVAIEITSQVQSGKNHFEIRLDPPELGRIEVRLDVDRDGHTTARMIADRSDTLDLMRRDASGLERALQDAGLKTSDNGLQFSLRDQTMGRQQDNTPAQSTAQIVVQDNTLPSNETTQRNYSRLAGLRGGIDIRV